LHRTLSNKYYVDEAYDKAVVGPIVKGSDMILWKWFDNGVIDRVVNGTAATTTFIAGIVRKVQTGVAQSYAVYFIGGILLVLTVLLYL
jgi:NADH-quinone oxidoreductase subunit L